MLDWTRRRYRLGLFGAMLVLASAGCIGGPRIEESEAGSDSVAQQEDTSGSGSDSGTTVGRDDWGDPPSMTSPTTMAPTTATPPTTANPTTMMPSTTGGDWDSDDGGDASGGWTTGASDGAGSSGSSGTSGSTSS